MDLTPAELTVLGLIVEEPRHGYDVEQVIEQRGIRQWTEIGFSSIYYLLTKLTERGLLEIDGDPGGRTSRRLFRATSHGRRIAAERALALIRDARPVPQPFLVGLANLPLLEEGELAEALRERHDGVRARLAGIRAARDAQSPLPRAADEIFSYSLALLEAESAWLADRMEASDD